jgi:hypothetical protein
MKRIAVLVLSLVLPGWIAGAAANPRLHDGGKSRYHSSDARHGGFYLDSGKKGYRDWASIPRGHLLPRDHVLPRDYLPPRDKCRAWFLSRLPGC